MNRRSLLQSIAINDFIVYLPLTIPVRFYSRPIRRLGLLNLVESLADPIGHRLPPAWSYRLSTVLQLALFIRLQMAQVRLSVVVVALLFAGIRLLRLWCSDKQIPTNSLLPDDTFSKQ